jgi:hypothetical protein
VWCSSTIACASRSLSVTTFVGQRPTRMAGRVSRASEGRSISRDHVASSGSSSITWNHYRSPASSRSCHSASMRSRWGLAAQTRAIMSRIVGCQSSGSPGIRRRLPPAAGGNETTTGGYVPSTNPLVYAAPHAADGHRQRGERVGHCPGRSRSGLNKSVMRLSPGRNPGCRRDRVACSRSARRFNALGGRASPGARSVVGATTERAPPPTRRRPGARRRR